MTSRQRTCFRFLITPRPRGLKYVSVLLLGCLTLLAGVAVMKQPTFVVDYLSRHGRISVRSESPLTFLVASEAEVADIEPSFTVKHGTVSRPVTSNATLTRADVEPQDVSKNITVTTSPHGSSKHPLSSTDSDLRSSAENEAGGFQPINGRQSWVYSAFFESFDKKRPLIRVLALEISTLKNPVFCHVTEKGSVTTSQGWRRVIPDNHGQKYYGVNYECGLKAGSRPEVVSLTFNLTDTPTNRVKVIYPKKQARNFTVCYAALHHFNTPTHLITSLTYNQVLGAQHFYVYNFSVSNTTDAVLRHYQRLGLLTVMPWPLPTLDVWYYGQILAINDCVYRNTFVSRFVVIQDTDEYIVPNRHNSWLELIEAVDANRAKDRVPPLGSYIFESSLHCNNPRSWEWEKVKKDFSITPEDEKFIRRHSLLPFIQLQRMDYIYKYKSRTKAIVRPELILYAGIHYTRKHRGRAALTVVSNDLAIVHHFSKKRRTQVVDTTTLRFKGQVFPMVKRSIESFEFLL